MIYTKTGDKGQTSLANGMRVSKADARLETYGTADELNAWVGMLRAALGQYPTLALRPGVLADPQALVEIDEHLLWVQNRLFNLGASLSAASGEWITAADTAQVEHWIDAMQADLTPLRAFVLPAGNELVARCHVCRTITRRLERLMVSLVQSQVPAPTISVALKEQENSTTVPKEQEKGIEVAPTSEECCFINRLSDYFFVLSRWSGEQTQAPLELWHK